MPFDGCPPRKQFGWSSSSQVKAIMRGWRPLDSSLRAGGGRWLLSRLLVLRHTEGGIDHERGDRAWFRRNHLSNGTNGKTRMRDLARPTSS